MPLADIKLLLFTEDICCFGALFFWLVGMIIFGVPTGVM
jgi:hypothetical protein